MKRKGRSLLALLMVMVMVLAMGVTSFAKTNDTVTVHVKIENPDGGYFYDDNVTVDKNTSLYDLADKTTIENYGTATAMDAIIAAADSVNYYKVQYTEYNPDTEKYEPINQYGLAFDTVNGIKGTSSTVDGVTTYKYWEIKINGNSAWNYATNYVLTDGMEIEVDWSVYVW